MKRLQHFVVSLCLLAAPPGANVFALDAATGDPLWDLHAGGTCRAKAMSFLVDGRQHVAFAMG